MDEKLVEAIKAELADNYVVGCCVIDREADEIARAILPIAMNHAAGIADAFQPDERWVEGLNVDVANVAKAEIAAAIRAAGQP